MAEPSVKVVIEADGTIRAGTLRPDLGAVVEARFRDSTKCKLAIDYKDPDVLGLTLGGDFSLRRVGLKNVRVEGELDRSLLDGRTEFRGKITWKIPKSVAVEVTTDVTKEETKVGTKVTLRF